MAQRGPFPGGRRFAFTILDDTDVATTDNVAPVYRLLADLGFRTTKTVWPVGCPEGSRNFSTSETLEDAAYLAFVRELARQGFEIASHGATMESSPRERTLRALDRFEELFGHPPRVYANHSYNRENLYWGVERLDDPVLRRVYSRLIGQPARHYQGEVEGSPWWWGDVAAERIMYARNLTFSDLNVRKINPSMPYRDPRRPQVPWWFSTSDAEDVAEFNAVLSERAQERLEEEGGIGILSTHLGKGFGGRGEVHSRTRELLQRLASRPGWFVPVGELLDWLREQRVDSGELPAGELPAGEWRRMQWRWAGDLVLRRVRSRFRS